MHATSCQVHTMASMAVPCLLCMGPGWGCVTGAKTLLPAQAAVSVRPQLDYVWEKGGEYAALTSQHSSQLYAASKTKASEAWDAAAPTAKQAYATTQVPALPACLPASHPPPALLSGCCLHLLTTPSPEHVLSWMPVMAC